MPGFRKFKGAKLLLQQLATMRIRSCNVADCHVALPYALVPRRCLLKQNTAASCYAVPNKLMRFTEKDEKEPLSRGKSLCISSLKIDHWSILKEEMHL